MEIPGRGRVFLLHVFYETFSCRNCTISKGIFNSSKRMAIKKESAQVSANSEQLHDKEGDGLIHPRRDLKDKKKQKDYEAGIDPQDEQLNTVPEGTGSQRGDSKPGSGNRLLKDTATKQRESDKK